MHSPVPVDLKTVRILLFVTAGFGFAAFLGLIALGAGPVDLMIGFWAYIGQALVTLVLGMLISRGRTWLLYCIVGYTVIALAISLLSLLGGDIRAAIQMLLPGLILYFTLRPTSKDYLRGRAAY